METNMHKPQIQTSQTAVDAFMARKAEIDTQLAQLQALSDEHFNVSPDEVHWGHVGDLSRYTDLLKQITDAVFKEGKHAE
jgi:chaperonin cofactor prefoldin